MLGDDSLATNRDIQSQPLDATFNSEKTTTTNRSCRLAEIYESPKDISSPPRKKKKLKNRDLTLQNGGPLKHPKFNLTETSSNPVAPASLKPFEQFKDIVGPPETRKIKRNRWLQEINKSIISGAISGISRAKFQEEYVLPKLTKTSSKEKDHSSAACSGPSLSEISTKKDPLIVLPIAKPLNKQFQASGLSLRSHQKKNNWMEVINKYLGSEETNQPKLNPNLVPPNIMKVDVFPNENICSLFVGPCKGIGSDGSKLSSKENSGINYDNNIPVVPLLCLSSQDTTLTDTEEKSSELHAEVKTTLHDATQAIQSVAASVVETPRTLEENKVSTTSAVMSMEPAVPKTEQMIMETRLDLQIVVPVAPSVQLSTSLGETFASNTSYDTTCVAKDIETVEFEEDTVDKKYNSSTFLTPVTQPIISGNMSIMPSQLPVSSSRSSTIDSSVEIITPSRSFRLPSAGRKILENNITVVNPSTKPSKISATVASRRNINKDGTDLSKPLQTLAPNSVVKPTNNASNPSRTNRGRSVRSRDFEFVSSDPAENADNFNPNWKVLENFSTEVERYKVVRDRWRNLAIPDPNKNLTFRHRRNQSFARPPRRIARKKRTGRSLSCTSIFEGRIRQAIHEHDEKLLAASCQYNDQLLSAVDIYVWGNGNQSFDQILCNIGNEHERKLHQLSLELAQTIARYEDYMSESRAFQNFYQGLDSNDDKTILTPEQEELLEDGERMYSFYETFYGY